MAEHLRDEHPDSADKWFFLIGDVVSVMGIVACVVIIAGVIFAIATGIMPRPPT
jgi:hypothetical protein